MFYIYFLKSEKNQKVYVGYTSGDVFVRLKQHESGTNAWTRQNSPFNLVYYESYFCEKDARARKRFYKSGVGKKIKKIILECL